MPILIIILSLALSILINIAAVHVTTRIFRVAGANWRTSALILLLYVPIILLIAIIPSFIAEMAGLKLLSYALSLSLGALVFHKLMVRNYQTPVRKNLAIFAVYNLIVVVVVPLLILPLRLFVFEPIYVKGAAMEPAYQENDYLIVNKTYKNYQRGDVVVFRYPKDPEQLFIKRIIGLPGEKIQMKDGSVILFSAAMPEGFKLVEEYLTPGTATYAIKEDVVELQPGEYYVLGDNRNQSKDSRSFGPVTADLILGKVWFKAGEMK